MPIVGEAHIMVRAITTNVAKDIRNGFNGVSGSGGKQAQKTGEDLASKFMRGFNKRQETNFLNQFADGLKEMNPAAEQGYNMINELVVKGYKGSVMAGVFAGAIGALIGSLVALIAAAAGAATSITAVIGIFIAMKAATAVAKMALEGVSEAVGKATQAQKNLKQTLRDTREELQQLKFDAEDAALAEEQAAISLEKAREGLARTADLPTDSRARREAELAYKQAELNYRRAKDKSNDLNEELRTGAKARAKAAADDPYANLTATQTAFAKFLVGLQPIFKNLREAVAQGFLPALQDGLTTLITSGTFNDIFNGIKGIGDALGRATKVLFDFFSSAEAGRYLREIFEMISGVVREFGPMLTKFFKAFLKIMAASSPIVMRLAKFISKMLDDFNGLLDATGDIGLRQFFITAADMAGKFGKIFGNIFGGFAKIVMANFGPGTGGDYLLNWLIEATEGFGTMGKSGDGLKAFFNAVAINAKSMLSGITSIIKQLVMFGADPNIGFFFEKIKEAAPSVSSILRKAGQALPTVAELIVKIVDIIDKLTDNAAIDNFFKTLVTGADMFQNILGNPVMEKILAFTGQIHAVTLGIKEIGDKVGPVFGFIQTSVTNVSDAMGKVGDYTKMATKAFKVAGVANAGMGDSIKKSMKSWKDAALDAEGFSAGTKRAFDYTGLMDKNDKMGKYFFKNATEGARKNYASLNPLRKGWGRMQIAIQGAHTRFKFFQIGATKGFTEMAKSQNNVIKTMGKMGNFMVGNPLLMIILAIVGAFVALYMSNEKFRKQIDAVFKPALEALGEAFRVIMVALQPVILAFQSLMKTLFGGSDGSGGGPLTQFFVMLAEVISKLVQALAPLIANLISKLMPIVEALLNLLIPIIEIIMKVWMAIQGVIMTVLIKLIEIVIKVVQVIMNILMPVIDGLMGFLMPLIDVWIKMAELVSAFFDALFTQDWNKFGTIFKDLGQGIIQSLANMFTGFINLIVDLLNALLKLVMLSPFIGFLADTVSALSGGAIDIRGAVEAGLIPKVPPIVVPQLFAKGGIVSPSAGGTLGIVAEAGRPERIEPLDPDGLSKRDKAMISMMGGGNGGINVTVNGTPDMDVNALAAEVSRRLAFQMRKGAAY
jgi:phage-related protein